MIYNTEALEQLSREIIASQRPSAVVCRLMASFNRKIAKRSINPERRQACEKLAAMWDEAARQRQKEGK